MKKSSLTILVTGSSGYIGSHVVKKLLSEGIRVIGIDKKAPSNKQYDKYYIFIKAGLADKKRLASIFKKYPIDVVIHLAALIRVDESMEKPDIYFKNNIFDATVLLEVMREFSVKKMIFASSAAVYGDSQNKAVKEHFLQQSASVYGLTKMVFENILDFYSRQYGFSAVSLRIFNACGADPSGELPERHIPESHLIPNILMALDTKKPITVYGDDYQTVDGTCVRDYVHINDISQAFLEAIPYVLENPIHQAFNIGSGKGFSIKKIITTCFLISGKTTHIIFKKRRLGDYPFLVCDNKKAKASLAWKPQYNLKDIVSHAMHSRTHNHKLL